jgi:hypothetical protein
MSRRYERPMSLTNRWRAATGQRARAHTKEAVRQGGHFEYCHDVGCREYYWVPSNLTVTEAKRRHRLRDHV